MNQKRVFGVSLLVLMSFLLIGAFVAVASAEGPLTTPSGDGIAANTAKVKTTVGDALSKWLSSGSSSTSWFAGENLDYMAKGLLMVLLALMVYSVFDFVPILPKKPAFIKYLVSAIIAILGFMFVSLSDIRYLVANYEALAIALTTILPLLIVCGFTLKMKEENPGLATIINPVVIVVFLVYLGARWGGLILAEDITQPSTLAIVYPIAMVVLLIWWFVLGIIARRKKMAEEKDTTERAAGTTLGAADEAVQQNLARKIKSGKALTDREIVVAKRWGLDVSAYES